MATPPTLDPRLRGELAGAAPVEPAPSPAQAFASGAPASAAEVCRGTMRLLAELGATALPEVPLGSGRRLDIPALFRDGTLTAVEVKSCRADYLGDRKWPEYLAWADRFYFAVALGLAHPWSC